MFKVSLVNCLQTVGAKETIGARQYHVALHFISDVMLLCASYIVYIYIYICLYISYTAVVI